jgi:hypothetical protein
VNPNSDDIAVAIVAACRETGGDPFACMSGAKCDDPSTFEKTKRTTHARHYALRALIHVFPDVNRIRLYKWVGVPGKPNVFWRNSWHSKGRGRAAEWWSDEVYDRVIRAIEADRTRRNVVPLPADEVAAPPPYRPPPGTIEKVLAETSVSRPRAPDRLGKLEPSGYRPPADAIAKVLEDELDARPVFDRGGTFSERRPAADYGGKAKKTVNLQEELRRAVENTVRLQSQAGE